MGKYFQFDRKIGWAHLISLLAFVLSIVSLWMASQRSSAQVVITRDSIVGGPVFDQKKERWRHFGYERVVLSNVGGAPITMVGLRLPSDSPFPGMISGTIKDKRPEEVTSEIVLIDDFLEDIKKNPTIISDYHGWSIERLGTLHRLIPPGGTLALTIGVLNDAYRGHDPIGPYVFTNLEFYFSDGSKQPYRIAAKIPAIH